MLNINKKTSIIIGLTIALLGFVIFMNDYFLEKKFNAYDYMNAQFLVLSESEIPDQSEEEEVVEEPVLEAPASDSKPVKTVQTYYIGSLEIPKIGFKRGFLDIDNRDNHVDRNIAVIKTSNYPNVDKGNFIIAGHSGTGAGAFFKNLYHLKEGDIANVYYHNVKYTYKITKIYLQDKIGRVAIYRDHSKTTLTLITCTKDNKTKQTIYIAELVSKQSY